MSIKNLLGIEHDNITDEEILEKIEEAQENKQTHIEIPDAEGNVVKIELPNLKLDRKLMDEGN
jgi:hypothetical protein